MVPSFRYLGRVILAADDDWIMVIRNLKKARAVWRRMTRVLNREGERPRCPDFLQSLCPVGVALWCRDVDGYPSYGTGPGRFPGLGGAVTDGEDPMEEGIL